MSAVASTGNVYKGTAYNGNYTTTALGSDASGLTVTGVATGTNVGTYNSALAVSGSVVLANYNTPTITNRSLVITPAPLGVEVTSTYSGTTTLTPAAFTATGLQNGETMVATSVTVNSKDVSSNGSNYVTAINAATGTALLSNYAITLSYNAASGTTTTNTATVNTAALTVKANDDAKFVTQRDNPSYQGATYSGFVQGETSSVLSGSLAIARSDSTNQAAGNYTLTPSGYGSTNGNYQITYQTGTFTIVPANTLLVKVGPTTTTYGTAPNYTATAAYLKSDNSTIVDLTSNVVIAGSNFSVTDGAGGAASFKIINPTPAATTVAGNYVAGSYTLGYDDLITSGTNFTSLSMTGALTVNPKALTITALADGKTYGSTTTTTNTLTYTASGQTASTTSTGSGYSVGADQLVTGDTITGVTLTSAGGLATASVNGGTGYTITPVIASSTGGLNTTNYTISYVTGLLTVNPATLTFTTTSSTTGNVYNGSTYTAKFTSTAVNGDEFTVSGLTTGTNAGTYILTPNNAVATNGASLSNYTTPTYNAGILVITPKAVTITDTAISRTYDGTSSYSTLVANAGYTSSGLVGSDAVGSVTQTIVAGGNTVSSGVAQAGSFTATPSAVVLSTGTAGNYTFSYVGSSNTIAKADLAVSAVASTGNVYKGTAYTGTYTTTALGTDESQITVTGVAIGTNVGTYTSALEVSGSVLDNYNSSTITNRSLAITAAPLGISLTGVYSGSTSIAPITYTFTGLQNNESLVPVSVTASSKDVAANGTNYVSSIDSIGGASTAMLSNYYLTSAYNGNAATNTTNNIVLSAAALNISAAADSKTYGATTTTLGLIYTMAGNSASTTSSGTGYTVSGLLGSDTISSLTLTSAGGLSTASVSGGAYVITPTILTASSSVNSTNYAIIYNTGLLSLNRAALTVTASNDTKVYGTTLTTTNNLTYVSTGATSSVTSSGAGYSVSGLVAGDTVSSVTLTSTGGLAGSTVAGGSGTNGAYTIAPTLGTVSSRVTDSNYLITFNTGLMTITKATLTLTAQDDAKTYGATTTSTKQLSYSADNGSASATAIDGTGYTVTGLYSGDTLSAVTLTSNGGLARSEVGGGTGTGGAYTIAPTIKTASGNVSSTNYDIVLGNGLMTVNRANLTFTTTPSTSGNIYNGSSYTTHVTSTAVNDDTFTVSGQATGTNAGTYTSALSATGAKLANYNAPSYVNGDLVITPKAVTITDTSISRTYDGTSIYSTLVGNAGYATSGLVGSDAVGSVTQTIVAGGNTVSSGIAQAGSFTATPSAAVLSTGAAGNYTFSYVAASNTIAKADLAVSAVASTGHVYKGTAYNGTYTTTALGSDASGLTVTGVATGTNVGTYNSALAVSGSAVLANYNTPTINNASLTVTQLASVAYIGASGGDWSLASNWAGGAIPTLGNVGTVQIASGKSVNYDLVTANSLSSSSSVSNNGVLKFVNNAALNFVSVISGTGTVELAGSGVLTLSGTNTYSGGTNLNSSSLIAGSYNALGTGTLNSTNGSFGTSSGIILPSLTVNGPVTLSTSIETSGAQIYNGAVTLSGGNAINGVITPLVLKTSNADISFYSTVMAGNAALANKRSLTLNAGTGSVLFSDSVGGTYSTYGSFQSSNGDNSPYQLIVTASTILLKANIVTFETQTYNGNILVGDNGTNGLIRTLISEDPAITFNGNIDDTILGQHSLVVTAVTTTTNQMPAITFNGDVGATTALKGLKATTGIQNSNAASIFTDTSIDPTQYLGNIVIAKNVTTIGDQTYTANVIDLGNGASGQTQHFVTTGGNLEFNVGVAANNGSMGVTAGSENLSLVLELGSGTVSGSGYPYVKDRVVVTPFYSESSISSASESNVKTDDKQSSLLSQSSLSSAGTVSNISASSAETVSNISSSGRPSNTVSGFTRVDAASLMLAANQEFVDTTDELDLTEHTKVLIGNVSIESNVICAANYCFNEN